MLPSRAFPTGPVISIRLLVVFLLYNFLCGIGSCVVVLLIYEHVFVSQLVECATYNPSNQQGSRASMLYILILVHLDPNLFFESICAPFGCYTLCRTKLD